MSTIRFGFEAYTWQMSVHDYRGRIGHIIDVISRAGGAGFEAEVYMLGDYASSPARLAEELDVPVVLSFLEGVGGKRAMNLPDGLHPNPEGHRRLAANILSDLAEIVTDL